MEHEYRRLFSHAEHEVPSEGLVGRIIEAITRKDRKRAKIRFIYSAFLLVTSAISFVPAIQYLSNETTQSGFFRYISLMFSDSAMLATVWKEFGLSIAESFPVFGVLAMLSVSFVFLFSLRGIIPTYKVVLKTSHQFN